MATLMGLPMELVCSILEEVGGSHLRRGPGAAGRLCLSRKWCMAAHPVFLSGLGTTDIKIYGHNLDELDDKYGSAGLRHLMYRNTRSLRFRFLGHFWDQNVAATYDSEDEDGNSIDSTEAHNEAPFDFTQPENQVMMETWRDEKLKPRLDALFEDLRNFSVLETLSIEASSDPSDLGQDGPHWNYLHQDTMVCLLRNLPVIHYLSTFTLDVCGMESSFCNEQPDVHLCESLAAVLPQIKNVRLRMPNICSSVLRLPPTRPRIIRLKTLALKLHLPSFARTTSPISKCCAGAHRFQNSRYLYEHLFSASQSFLHQLATYHERDLDRDSEAHGLTGLRISYKQADGTVVATVDCLTKRYVFIPGSFFNYEDDGSPCWYEFEPGRMLEGPPFLLRSETKVPS